VGDLRLFALALVGVSTCAGCALLIDLSSLGSHSDAGASDASSDAPLDGANPVSVIVTVGNVPQETGTAQQQHLVYASHSARWWLFYLDESAPTTLDAIVSSDFSVWTPVAGRALSLTMDNEGRNFSVAYGDLGGGDVIHGINSHFVAGTTEDVRHARMTIDQATPTYIPGDDFATASPFDSNADPDGCVTAIGTDGFIYDSTGWRLPTNHADFFRSTTADTGGSSTTTIAHAFYAMTPGSYVHNRAIVPTVSANMLGFWPTMETTKDTGNVYFVNTSAPATIATVFPGGMGTATQSANDWNVCAVKPNDIHAVRRKLDGGKNDTFDHVAMSNGTTWASAAAIANDPGKYDSGVVMVSNGTTILLVTIASDAANSVRATKWDGVSWSSWQTLLGTTATRTNLSGTGCGTSAEGAVVWTEAVASNAYRVVGIKLTSLF
jgi:hypothetical protein